MWRIPLIMARRWDCHFVSVSTTKAGSECRTRIRLYKLLRLFDQSSSQPNPRKSEMALRICSTRFLSSVFSNILSSWDRQCRMTSIRSVMHPLACRFHSALHVFSLNNEKMLWFFRDREVMWGSQHYWPPECVWMSAQMACPVPIADSLQDHGKLLERTRMLRHGGRLSTALRCCISPGTANLLIYPMEVSIASW